MLSREIYLELSAWQDLEPREIRLNANPTRTPLVGRWRADDINASRYLASRGNIAEMNTSVFRHRVSSGKRWWHAIHWKIGGLGVGKR